MNVLSSFEDCLKERNMIVDSTEKSLKTMKMFVVTLLRG